MPNTSLRAQLKKIGEPRPGQAIPAFPGGFHSAPHSLKIAMQAMNPPQIETWVPFPPSTFDNLGWTENCQGLTSHGQSWFIVSNGDRAIRKFTLDFTHLGKATCPEAHHVGDPDHHAGKIYVPVETISAVWVLDTNLNTLGVTPLGGAPGASPQKGSMPWCAINPWNGFLYSSIFGRDDPEEDDFGNVDRVYIYDPNDNFSYKGHLLLQGGIVHNVQGGCFSQHGHLYLTSDSTEEIRVYSALNGSHLGSCRIPVGSGAEEVEGIAILHWFASGGISTHVHVLVLDDDWPDTDDVRLWHYVIPDPGVL